MAVKSKRGARQQPVFEAPTRRPGSMGGPRRADVTWLHAFWQSPPQLNRATQALASVACLLLIFIGARWAAHLPALEFQRISLQGDIQHVQHGDIEPLVQRWRGNFLTLDLERVRSDVENLTWVKSANIARRWPAELVIDVREHVPVARWGRRSLVDGDGEVFAAEVKGSFPHFYGPEEVAPQVLTQYQKLLHELAPIGLKPLELRVSPRLAWEVELDNGLKLELGRDDFAERLQTFLTAYRVELHNLPGEGTVVDLRYKHGLALKVAQVAKKSAGQPLAPEKKRAQL